MNRAPLTHAPLTLLLALVGCGGDSPQPTEPAQDAAVQGDDDAHAADDASPDDVEAPPEAALPAFPGAEGFGASATGGRGGRVLTVTTLEASGPGSLQAALDEEGPRTIVFAVTGVVKGVPILSRGDVTVAGQTSPGGVTLRGLLIQGDEVCEDPDCPLPTIYPENFIVRHVRLRPAGIDDANGAGDGLRLHHARRGILDHVSVGNADDEAAQISFSSDLTLQWSLLAETVGGHAEFGGMLINYSDPARGFPLTRISIHHVMWNRIFGRVPEVSRENVPDARVMELELSNNVLHDAERPIYLAAANPQTEAPLHYALNMVGNHVSADPAVPESYGLMSIELGPGPMSLTPASSAFLSGNGHSLTPDRADWQLVYCCNDFRETATSDLPWPSNRTPPPFARADRHPFPPITYSEGGRALVVALAERAGAFPRDPMDRRLMADPLAGTFAAASQATNPSNDALSSDWRTPPTPPSDRDRDGMPDAWEADHGLDPDDAEDRNATSLSLAELGVEGYTNLEVWLHARSIEVVEAGRR
jgi:hypothetical protein